MKRVLVRAVAATAIGAAALGGVSVAAFAATDSVQACERFVAPPDSNVGGYVWVSGSRRGCGNAVKLTLELKKSSPGVDGVVKTVSGNGVNFEITSKVTCSEARNRGTFYGRLTSSDGGGAKEGTKQTEC